MREMQFPSSELALVFPRLVALRTGRREPMTCEYSTPPKTPTHFSCFSAKWKQGDVIATWFGYYASGYGGHCAVYWGPSTTNPQCISVIDQDWSKKKVEQHDICNTSCFVCKVADYYTVLLK